MTSLSVTHPHFIGGLKAIKGGFGGLKDSVCQRKGLRKQEISGDEFTLEVPVGITV